MALPSSFGSFLREYTTLLVLLVLGLLLSVVTLQRQSPTGAAAGRQLAETLVGELKPGAGVLIVVRDIPDDRALAAALAEQLAARKVKIVETVQGNPADAVRAIKQLVDTGKKIDAVACTDVTIRWPVFDRLGAKYPALAAARVVQPQSYLWPSFLKGSNLLNVANQIAVIAIVAIGMTMVIVAGGIDLSVGSLIALSAIITVRLIRDLAGGVEASEAGMTACAIVAIAACAAAGAISGGFVTLFDVPPFIVTLAMMLIASGLAFIVAENQSINQVPESIDWLGGDADLVGIPNAVVLMLLLYAAAHVVMSRTTFGRYLYAVGGNSRAAWLCGVPVRRVVVASYVICGGLAGLGGVILASQFKSGSPTYGQTYELQVIAAVVVGGTSLSGGVGKMTGTLLGALIIAVIQNGMNLIGLNSNLQKIVLGVVILAAVLLDRLKHIGGRE
jgi:ribose transport system permease protein